MENQEYRTRVVGTAVCSCCHRSFDYHALQENCPYSGQKLVINSFQSKEYLEGKAKGPGVPEGLLMGC